MFASAQQRASRSAVSSASRYAKSIAKRNFSSTTKQSKLNVSVNHMAKFSGAACVAGLASGTAFAQKSDHPSYHVPSYHYRDSVKHALHLEDPENLSVFSGTANPALADEIAKNLQLPLGRVDIKNYADGETGIKVLDNVRGKEVYIIQPTCPPGVNNNLMELLLLISTMKRASAQSITAIIPYYGYARQDRKLASRVPISAADCARMLESMGVDRVVAVDLHCGQIQGFFGPQTPCDNLEAQVVALDHFSQLDLVGDTTKVISPDAGGVYRAKSFRDGLAERGIDAGLAMIIKQRVQANQIERMDLVGEVDGCDVIIVDDMIDTAGTLCTAAKELKNRGAKRVYAFATHGVFSDPAYDRIKNSVLEEVVVCNTIPLREDRDHTKITQLSVGKLLAEAIARIHSQSSVSALFTKEPASVAAAAAAAAAAPPAPEAQQAQKQ